MKSKMIRMVPLLGQWIQVIIPGIVFVVFWQLYVGGNQHRRFFYATPSMVASRLGSDIWNRGLSDGLLKDIGVTGLETLLGFLLGTVVGTVSGLFLWVSPRLARIARPYVTIAGTVPVFAIAPMMIIWFGTGLFSKVMVAGLSTVFVALVQAFAGARNIDRDLIDLMKTLGATKWHVYQKLIIPATLVWVIASSRLNIGFALLGAFIGEFISSERGVGHYILQGSGLYDVSQVLAGIICMIVLSFLMNAVVSIIEYSVLPWKR